MYEIKDGYIVTDRVVAKWPCLTRKNGRYNKYTVAIEMDVDEAQALLHFMDERLDEYLSTRPKAADMPRGDLYEPIPLEGDRVRFNIQNRQQPELYNSDGTPFTGDIEGGSVLRMVLGPVCYTNNANNHVGVSLRVLAVEVVKATSAKKEAVSLLGLTAKPDEPAAEALKQPDDWEALEEELRQARLVREARQQKSREQEAQAAIDAVTAYETDKALNGAGRRNYR